MRNDFTMYTTRVGTLALGATLVLGACAKRDNANSDTTATTTTTMTPATGTSDTGAMAGANANATSSANASNMSDANILSVISMANSNEIGTSKLAQTKATNASVKSYANDMVKDHTTMQGEADKVAKAANVTPEAPAGVGDQMKAQAMAMSDSLKAATKGTTFDTQYINGQVMAHQQVLDHLQQFQSSAQNAQLKDLVTKAIPKVQQHLDRAKQIQSQLGTRA
jgi:putative membrane protein